MNLLKDTIKYTNKNFFKLAVFSIFPALALAAVGSMSSLVTFFVNFENNSTTVWQVYEKFSLISGRNWWLGVLSVFVVSFFLCLLVSAIERHMKVGKFSLTRPFAKINDTVLAVFPIYAIFVLSLELTALIVAMLIMLVKLISGAAALYVSIVVAIGVYMAALLLFTQFILWTPCMVVVGYPFKDACIYSTKLIAKAKTGVFFDFTLMYMIGVTVSAAVSLLSKSQLVIMFFADAIVYSALIALTVAYGMIAYFKITDEPRRDLESSKNKFSILR